jgi:hypothetical protein
METKVPALVETLGERESPHNRANGLGILGRVSGPEETRG